MVWVSKEELEGVVLDKVHNIVNQRINEMSKKLQDLHLIQEEINILKQEVTEETKETLKELRKDIQEAQRFKDLLLEVTRENKEVMRELKSFRDMKDKVQKVNTLFKSYKLNEKGLTRKENFVFETYLNLEPKRTLEKLSHKTNYNIDTLRTMVSRIRRKGKKINFD